jgi:hypothetical protein
MLLTPQIKQLGRVDRSIRLAAMASAPGKSRGLAGTMARGSTRLSSSLVEGFIADNVGGLDFDV